MTVDMETLEQFFDTLHAGGQVAHWWKYDGKVSIWFDANKRKWYPSSWENDGNIYFCIHPCTQIPDNGHEEKGERFRKSRVDFVAAINCVFAEFDAKDYGDKDTILAHLWTLPIYPSVVIDSGGGFHCYWLLSSPVILTDGNRGRVQRLQYAWVDTVGGDDASKDLARVLRVPGTKNHKEKYAPNYPTVSFVECDFDRVYSLAEIEAILGDGDALNEPPPRKSSRRTTTTTTTDDLITAATSLRRLSSARADDYGDWLRVGMALHALGDAGLQLWDEWSQQSDKYTSGGCDAKWESFTDGGVTLGTLVHMANEDTPTMKLDGVDTLATDNGFGPAPSINLNGAPYVNGHSSATAQQPVRSAAFRMVAQSLALAAGLPTFNEQLDAITQLKQAIGKLSNAERSEYALQKPLLSILKNKSSVDEFLKSCDGDDQGNINAKVNKPTQIYQLALEHCNIFTGDDGATYATVSMGGHFENMNVRSMRFRQWLGKLYYDKTGMVAGKSSCEEAVEVLSFQTGTALKTFLRVGGTDTSFYLDLGNSAWEAVEIDADGWRVLSNAPVAFRRTAKMQPLPMPVKTNVEAALVELFKLINIAVDDRMLVIAWLLAAMRHKGPYPVLTLIAEPGSAKTTTAKALKRLISPYVAETRSRPKAVEDVYVAGNNDWILVYDNLSSIPLDISDAFCRMATGGGFATRELYQNLEEVVIDQQQPLIINGVADIVRKGDLASRIVTVTLPTITPDNRIDESEWERRFTDAHPRILGSLLDLLSHAMAELPTVKCPLPRMADFAKLGIALDTVTGITGQTHSFAERYAESNRQGTMTVIENSPTYRPLWRFMERAGSWDGTAASLLEELRKVSTFTEKLDLPKAGNALVKELNGIAPNLRTAQIIDIRCGRTKKGSHISLTKLSDFDRGELDNAYNATDPDATPGF